MTQLKPSIAAAPSPTPIFPPSNSRTSRHHDHFHVGAVPSLFHKGNSWMAATPVPSFAGLRKGQVSRYKHTLKPGEQGDLSSL